MQKAYMKEEKQDPQKKYLNPTSIRKSLHFQKASEQFNKPEVKWN
uniref:Uncharacterized protein n=1 Tax=Rhizophora mucronata TaxID=61149 RepID=A0A2P2QH05_RHIMU